ncbi:phage tail sheath protein [Clostridium botulinum C]|uniref:Phage tail sheath protein n=2 Tax=Clostridium botulinum TaxID=1491 RepID=A0A9Q4XWD4_CLOBO|nr:phage tail sheath family protein [Clostridium botulinum]EGO86262.1 phage portal protein [Clostridium botulinum C str. Stockholm]MCD3195699.1 phage tail sheath protein [Clostridium botulinum C]MCD3201115.1 phage tail sheath protein [Clostridium botulinum C]MCD3206633.1 phage tail sheath protein [Clostridium botulinum C]MCD3209368.1 phage tail sheath protein [Clostridium botulinum C]
MASGYWSETDKPIRPGFYNRFKAAALARIEPGKRGIVAMPIKANWGPVKKVVSIKDEKDLIEKFGNDPKYTSYKLGRLALLGQPKKLLLYRLADKNEKVANITLKDTTVSSAVEVLKLETIYPTTRDFNITVRTNIVDDSKTDIVVYEAAKQVYVFNGLSGTIEEIVTSINSNEENKWLKATKLDEGNGKLASVANQTLTGGDDGTKSITNEHYLEAMSAFEGVKFNGFTLDGVTDSALQTSVKAWVERNRKNGKKIRAYIGGKENEKITEANNRSKSFNYEGILNIGTTGGILDGIEYTPAETAVYICALGEGQDLKECLCNQVTIFEGVTKNLTNEEIKSALQDGTMIIRYDDGAVVIEDDVNTLKRYGQEQDDTWGYLRAIKFMDAIDEDTSFTGNRQYVGKVTNNRNGQLAVLCSLKQYFETLQSAELIEPDFKVCIDEELQKNAKNDEFFWKWNAKYINVMKKIYGTGYIR